MTETLRELALRKRDHFQRLGVLQRAPSMEWIWLLAALESTIEGKLLEPDIDALKQLTTEARIWEGLQPAWPADHVGSVVAAVVTSHRLAIVKRDDDWLALLYGAWETSPEDLHYLLRLRVQGEIGLALAPGGPRPLGWSDEEMSELEDEGFVQADAPPDQAWAAIGKRDLESGRRALADYEKTLAMLPGQWEAAPSEGLRQILANPDALFQIERRALATLMDRT